MRRSIQRVLPLILLAGLLPQASLTNGAELECTHWNPGWLWCDDFESDAELEDHYFEVNRAGGLFGVSSTDSFGGESSLRSEWALSGSEFGNVKLSIGRTPVAPSLHSDTDFSEIYWRFYLKSSANWQGPGDKLTRAMIFAASNWSQAAIAHVWQGDSLDIGLDPASGIEAGLNGDSVITTGYNDFDHLRWLGKANGETDVYAAPHLDTWICVEAHVKLNTVGQSDGEFHLWLNGELDAARTELNWRGSYDAYGINAIFLENYKGSGPSNRQYRFIDNFIVSTQPIGCLNNERSAPVTPPNFTAELDS